MHLSAQEHSGHALFVLVIVFLITYLILTFYNPEWVQRSYHGKKTGENDQATTMLWSLAIAVGILVLLGVILYCFSCYN